jgi:hypothetical protein
MTTVQSFAGRDYVSRPVNLPQAKPMFGRSHSEAGDSLTLSKNMAKTPKEPHFGFAPVKTATLVVGGLAALAGALPQKTSQTSVQLATPTPTQDNFFHQEKERQCGPACSPPPPSTSTKKNGKTPTTIIVTKTKTKHNGDETTQTKTKTKNVKPTQT